MSERDERPAFQGPRGPQGNQGNMGNQGNPGSEGERGSRGVQGVQGVRGERGVPGLSPAVRRALVFLFALNLLLAAANFAWTAHSVNADNQQRCATVEANATIPLPRPVAGSPSGRWESAFEANARTRARQLGCE